MNSISFTYILVTIFFLDIFHSVRLEQGTVTCLVEEKGTIKGVQYKNTNGQLLTAYAPLTIVCDGCFSNLRRSLCKPKVIKIDLHLVFCKDKQLCIV